MIRLIAALGLILAVALPAFAQADYPTRPVRIVIGFSPGSVADTPARLLAQKFSQKFGQQFVVENKPGAGSNIAAEFVARAEKDGYTLLMSTAAQTINATISRNLTFDFAKDFSPIAMVASVPIVLVAHPSLGVDNVRDLIALAKSKPGEILYGSSGLGTTTHLAGELINVMAGIKLGHVPYPGSAQSIADVVAGRIPLLLVPAAPVMQFVNRGDLKALAVTQLRRTGAAPNLPTMSEAGLPGFDIGLWFGLVAPTGTPRAAIDKIAGAAAEALQSPEIVAALTAAGIDPMSDSGPDDFARFVASDIKNNAAIAKAAGLVN